MILHKYFIDISSSVKTRLVIFPKAHDSHPRCLVRFVETPTESRDRSLRFRLTFRPRHGWKTNVHVNPYPRKLSHFHTTCRSTRIEASPQIIQRTRTPLINGIKAGGTLVKVTLINPLTPFFHHPFLHDVEPFLTRRRSMTFGDNEVIPVSTWIRFENFLVEDERRRLDANTTS